MKTTPTNIYTVYLDGKVYSRTTVRSKARDDKRSISTNDNKVYIMKQPITLGNPTRIY